MYLWIYHVRHQGLYLWRDGRIERWQFVAIGAPAGHVRSGFGPGGPLADVVLMVFLDFEVDLAAATAFPRYPFSYSGFYAAQCMDVVVVVQSNWDLEQCFLGEWMKDWEYSPSTG